VHLTPYAAPHSGSFIPMLEAARGATESQGWSFEAVFPRGAEQHDWYRQLSRAGMGTRLAPWLNPIRAAAWIGESLAGRRGRVLLHTHFSSWDVAAALAGLRRPETTVVWHLHTPLHDELSMRARSLVRFGLIARLVDRILCVGPEIHQKALARLAPARRTVLFPNGVDVDRFLPPQASEREAARLELGFGLEKAVLLLFAWDWERKGGALMLDAIAQVRSHGRDVGAVIVGAKRQARERAAGLGITEAVRTPEPSSDARPMFAAADAYITASAAEGLPFSVLEALSCELPVIASDIPSHRLVADSVPGCTIVPRRAASFALAIEATLDRGAGERSTSAGSSRSAVIRDYSLQRWSERLTALYHELLDDARVRAG
jgi:glycosyltransferase involved in cell wall biosynthesis